MSRSKSKETTTTQTGGVAFFVPFEKKTWKTSSKIRSTRDEDRQCDRLYSITESCTSVLGGRKRDTEFENRRKDAAESSSMKEEQTQEKTSEFANKDMTPRNLKSAGKITAVKTSVGKQRASSEYPHGDLKTKSRKETSVTQGREKLKCGIKSRRETLPGKCANKGQTSSYQCPTTSDTEGKGSTTGVHRTMADDRNGTEPAHAIRSDSIERVTHAHKESIGITCPAKGKTRVSSAKYEPTGKSPKANCLRSYKSDGELLNYVSHAFGSKNALDKEHEAAISDGNSGTKFSKANEGSSRMMRKPRDRHKRNVVGVVGSRVGPVDNASAVRRYALYRGMVNSGRLSKFLTKQPHLSNDDSESVSSEHSVGACSKGSRPIAPWEHGLEMYETPRICRRLVPVIPEIVSEPDIPLNKWDLRGTKFPKRIFIRETVNGAIVDEVVDVRDEKDWGILTYMSPLRPADLRSGRKSRDIGFQDLKDFEVYCFVFPWKCPSENSIKATKPT